MNANHVVSDFLVAGRPVFGHLVARVGERICRGPHAVGDARIGRPTGRLGQTAATRSGRPSGIGESSGAGTEYGSRRSRPARICSPRRTSAILRAIGPSTGMSWKEAGPSAIGP